jgi:hypothetical protein
MGGQAKEIPPNNELSGEGHGWFPARWGWSGHPQATYISPKLFLLLACFTFTCLCFFLAVLVFELRALSFLGRPSTT